MATLGLVSCTKSKEPHACRAEEMYVPSALFRKAWQYAGEHYGSRAILSAKYGLLLADDVIAPYDESLRDATAAQRFAWAKMVLDQMRRRLDMSEIRDVYFHCPKAYSYPLAAVLEELGMQVHLPMKGLKQGEQLGWYGRQGAPSAAPLAGQEQSGEVLEKELLWEGQLTFDWPVAGAEYFERACRYRVAVQGGQTAEIMVAFGWRPAFGRTRRRIIAFMADAAPWPAAELVGADDYNASRELLWAVKKPGSNQHCGPFEQPHPDFRSFPLILFRDRIQAFRSHRSWAVLLHEDDIDSILRLGLIRAGHRHEPPAHAQPKVATAAGVARPPERGLRMTNTERVRQYFIRAQPGGATIRDIQGATGVAPYAQVYQITQRLVDEGFLRFERRGRGRGGGKIFSPSETLPPTAAPKAAVPSGRPPPGQGRRGPTEAAAAQRERVAGSLLAYGEELAAKGQSGIVEFTQDPAANRLILEAPLAFVLGVVCAQLVKAETAWALPHLLKARLGHLDPDRIGQMTEQELAAVLARPSALHRLPNKMADYVLAACEKVVKAYAGDASRIWIGCSSSSEIARRFDEFRGIAQKKSSMAVNILVRDLGVQVADPENIDVSYDVHVRRVFLRSGVVDTDSQEEVVAAGRELHPEYPGALDLPAWYTGRNWCHPASPDCGGCPLSSACPERVELDVETF